MEWLADWLSEILPGLLVLLYGLMQVRYWLLFYRCQGEARRLREIMRLREEGPCA